MEMRKLKGLTFSPQSKAQMNFTTVRLFCRQTASQRTPLREEMICVSVTYTQVSPVALISAGVVFAILRE